MYDIALPYYVLLCMVMVKLGFVIKGEHFDSF